ncbi:MAG TPA: VOC family protein [Acidimicrobiales bacterium]|nr:VOC family protein [Acidimicrobiales bacterium]
MRTLGVHHVSIKVADTREAIRFYCDVLGLSARSDRPDLGFGGAWLDAGGQQVHLVEGELPQDQGQHFALQVDDLGAAIDELRSRGVSVSDPIPIASAQQAFVNDPDGNLIELHQPG